MLDFCSVGSAQLRSERVRAAEQPNKIIGVDIYEKYEHV